MTLCLPVYVRIRLFPHKTPSFPPPKKATLGGAASLISTTLAKAFHGYGAAAWLSLIAVISLSALVVGYHPGRGLVMKQQGKWK